jgi:hypothetical protein
MREVTVNVAITERQQVDVPVRLDALGGDTAPPAPASTAPVVAPAQVDGMPPPRSPEALGTVTPRAAPWRTTGLVVAGAGIVGLGVGAAFGLTAQSKNDQSNHSGCNGNDCTAPAAAVRRDALSAASASTVAFVLGGVLTAGGVVMWLVAPSHNADQALGLTPMPLPGGGGLVATGQWR